jgi:hypothetical protein
LIPEFDQHPDWSFYQNNCTKKATADCNGFLYDRNLFYTSPKVLAGTAAAITDHANMLMPTRMSKDFLMNVFMLLVFKKFAQKV